MASLDTREIANKLGAMILDEIEIDGEPLRNLLRDARRYTADRAAGKYVKRQALDDAKREISRLTDLLQRSGLSIHPETAPDGSTWPISMKPEDAAELLRNASASGALRVACLQGAEALQHKRAPGHGFYMSDDEIRSSWRRCANQQTQVQILADLNCVSITTMKKKLQDMGLYQPREKKTCSTE